MTIPASHVSRRFLFALPLDALLDTDHRRSAPGPARGASPRAEPGCSGGKIVSPYATDVLILIGKDDAVTTADRCLKTVAARANQARPPAIKVYPGALHAFDIGGVPRPSPLDYMFGGNAEAAADSFAMTEAFFDARLKSK